MTIILLLCAATNIVAFYIGFFINNRFRVHDRIQHLERELKLLELLNKNKDN